MAQLSAGARLGQRLLDVRKAAEENREHLHLTRADIFFINDERACNRRELHKSNMEMLKQVVSTSVKAPGLEKAMSIKARLRKIDAAARINAVELDDRCEILATAARDRLDRSVSEPKLTFDGTQSFLSGPMFPTEDQLTRQRYRQLPALEEGPDRVSRMAAAVAQARVFLQSRGRLRDGDLDWADDRLEAYGVRPPAWPQESEQGLAANEAAPGAGAAAAAPLAKSASAPLLARSLASTARRPARLPHDCLYPSMLARVRVAEEHLHRNAASIETLRDVRREIATLH